MLRKVLNELDPVEAMEMLITKMKKTQRERRILDVDRQLTPDIGRESTASYGFFCLPPWRS